MRDAVCVTKVTRLGSELGMATIHITLSIHHRGRFEREPVGKVSYIGGEVTEIERINVDTLNGFFISDLLKDIGYTSISEFYWLEPGKELHDGLRLLRADMDVVRMYEAAMKNGNRINLYTEHPVDQPVVVEVKELTPSKGRRKVCAKRVPTPKKTPRRRLAVVEDDDDAEIVGSPDEPPSTHSQPSQPPLEVEQQPSETHGTDPVPPHDANVSEASQQPWQSDDTDQFIPSQANVSDHIAPEQVTQYIPHPYRNLLSQEIPESAPPSDSNRTPQNNETNASDEAEGQRKKNRRRSTKRPPPTGQTFIPNPDPDKPPTFYVPVDQEDFSDDNAGYHCYESEDLRSIPSDEDSDDTTAFPQSNADAPVSQVRLEGGMEFETLNQFRKAVRKFNINIGRSIFFARCDSTRSKAICYDEDFPWQIYCANRTFPASYQVKTFVNEHTCSRDNHCKSADVPSQEFLEHVDTLPILPPRYRKPIGRPSMKRDKRNDAPKDKSDPHRTKRRIGTIVCKYCLQAGHNKRSCKKRKEAMGEGSAAPQVPASDEDEDMLAKMYYEETLEAAEAEAAATEVGNGSTAAQTSQPPPPMPHPAATQPHDTTTTGAAKKQHKRRSVKRPPPSAHTP
ncbi:hypothetical protein Ahy_B06g080815 [Arachis hypogaea]|uniref:Uncharacterized protein n=1 Tax=Arachis hypogaea TaxID=3818 RepID=A0A444YJ78_ARAHY|nr:hypothetical protein Ahy_B06g080815 [Arachis hypogaea]